MGFYACWQPLVDEDRHTALVFGFFRHAPVSLALGPWLSRVLGRPVEPQPLQPESFWPLLPSIVDGNTATEPELVFDAADEHGALKVVVEVKPGSAMHTVEQISREIIDVANASGADRIALVMIGADLARPAATADWPAQIAAEVLGRSLAVEAETVYSSFALIGELVAAAAHADPAWKPYADDVIAQLKRKGLLEYGGAPMLDDLDGLTLPNAVEVFNRIIASARQFYLQLHEHSDFIANGLQPDLGDGVATSPRMLRDGRTAWIGQPEASFKTKVILSTYTHPELKFGSRLFVAFDLLARDATDIQFLVGRWDFAADRPDVDPRRLAAALINERRSDAGNGQLPYQAQNGTSLWTYDRRTWQPGSASEDIEWVTNRAVAAVRVARSLRENA